MNTLKSTFLKAIALISLVLIVNSCDDDDPSTGIVIDPSLDERGQFIQVHNDARAEVGVDALVWSDELADYAEEWAIELSSRGCQLEHRPRDGAFKQIYGENLYMSFSSNEADVPSLAEAALAWYSEIDDYNGEPIGESVAVVGHYTQIVWRNTTEVGAAKIKCDDGSYIIVANYNPPGNWIGERPY
ncbi:MAG: CAP domain-containing protein [Candidatus Kapaibacteriales bacterium]